MSVKEFFAYPNIKQTTIEFLKKDGNFEALPAKNKKAFRAHINKHALAQQAFQPLHPQPQQQDIKTGMLNGVPAGPGLVDTAESALNQPTPNGGNGANLSGEIGSNQQNDHSTAGSGYADFFVSDGFNSIKCQFSEVCKEKFQHMYPQSIKIYQIVNMLICVQSYTLVLKNIDEEHNQKNAALTENNPAGLPRFSLSSGFNLEVVLVIDELKVISFDRLSVKMPSSVHYDDLVRTYLAYMKHQLSKKGLLSYHFQMASIADLPLLQAPAANEERSTFFSGTGSRYNQRPPMGSNSVVNPEENTAKQGGVGVGGGMSGAGGAHGHGGAGAGGASEETKANSGQPAKKSTYQFKQTEQNSLQLKSDSSGSNKQKKRDRKRLRKLDENAFIDGFISCAGASDSELISDLKRGDSQQHEQSLEVQSPAGVEPPLSQNRSFSKLDQAKKNPISSNNKSQPSTSAKAAVVDFEDADLEEIDELMEVQLDGADLDFDSGESDDGKIGSGDSQKRRKTSEEDFSPTQPILLSQNMHLLQKESSSSSDGSIDEPMDNADGKGNTLRSKRNGKGKDGKQCLLEDILGDERETAAPTIQNRQQITKLTTRSSNARQQEHQQPSAATATAPTGIKPQQFVEIINNEERISNSSTPIENEKIQRQAEIKQNKNKIELDFEMTEEQKKQQDALDFGATPYSASSSVQSKTLQANAAGTGIGHGLNSLQNQRDLIEFKRQGQQGVQGSPNHPNNGTTMAAPNMQICSSQVDLLDILADSKSQSVKDFSQQNQNQKTASSGLGMSRDKGKKAKTLAPGQGSLDFFIKRQDRKSTVVAKGDTTAAAAAVKKDSVPKMSTINDFQQYKQWFGKNAVSKVEDPEKEELTLAKKGTSPAKSPTKTSSAATPQQRSRKGAVEKTASQRSNVSVTSKPATRAQSGQRKLLITDSQNSSQAAEVALPVKKRGRPPKKETQIIHVSSTSPSKSQRSQQAAASNVVGTRKSNRAKKGKA